MQNLLFDNCVRFASISSRRYLGNKYRLLPFIESVIAPYEASIDSVADICDVARKMNRDTLKSRYCTRQASVAFEDLITHIQAKYILVSYNNMGASGDGRSNARISDSEITEILSAKGNLEVFSTTHKAFTAGKSSRYRKRREVVPCIC